MHRYTKTVPEHGWISGGQIRALFGISTTTYTAWRKTGKIPKPAYESPTRPKWAAEEIYKIYRGESA